MSATEEWCVDMIRPIALTHAPEQPRYSTTPPKRKASSSPQRSVSGSPKRLKRSPSPPRNGRSPSRGRADGLVPAEPAERRVAISQEEKRRGMRLFGGLLTTLSQPRTGSQQQRRLQEIEQRHQEGVGRQRVDDRQQRAENTLTAAHFQKTQQLELDELVMKRRHGSLGIMARSLRTAAEPPLYYLPWKLTKEQQETIEQQTVAIEALVGRETQAFARRREIHEKQMLSLQSAQSSAPSERVDKRDAAQPHENGQRNPVAPRRNGDDDRHENSVDWGEGESKYEAVGERQEAGIETELTQEAGDSSHGDKVRLKTDWSGALKDDKDDESGDVVVEGHEDDVIY